MVTRSVWGMIIGDLMSSARLNPKEVVTAQVKIENENKQKLVKSISDTLDLFEI